MASNQIIEITFADKRGHYSFSICYTIMIYIANEVVLTRDFYLIHYCANGPREVKYSSSIAPASFDVDLSFTACNMPHWVWQLPSW